MDQAHEAGRTTWIEGALARYEGPLVSYAARLLGDAHRARDAAQETFLRLVAAERGEVDGHLGPWLFTVCRRHCVDVLRKETRMQAADTELLDRHVGHEADPAAVAESRDGTSRALGAVAALPPNQREVVELRFRHGLAYSEIARVTGLSATNVGFLLHVAMKTLRSRLGAPDGAVRGDVRGDDGARTGGDL
jgi:RNA polymerase sigma-70 factor (ECF subfamily)